MGIRNSIGMVFVYISPGTYIMGSPVTELGRLANETPHEVTLTKGYYMQTTEVTQGQWRTVMGTEPSYFESCGDECPVERVTWDDAYWFTEELNRMDSANTYRLPTEAEWEYACRAGSTSAFADGGITEIDCYNDANLNAMGWYCWNSGVSYSECKDISSNGGSVCAGTHPAALKQANAWGLYDMHGNVWEWCQDWYDEYPTEPAIDPSGPYSGSLRVLRGGSYNTKARSCRSAWRNKDSWNVRYIDVGFRLVLLPLQ